MINSAAAKVIPFPEVAKILGFPSIKAAYQARYRGTLPFGVHTRPNSKSLYVLRADLDHYLQTGEAAEAVIQKTKSTHKKRGRPSNADKAALAQAQQQ